MPTEGGGYHSKVGGCEKRLEEARPVLSSFASKVLHMGATGNGQLAKALNNCLAPRCWEKISSLLRRTTAHFAKVSGHKKTFVR
jgi:6-phosphogluconate dehydrogenase (decarboxylating)